MNRRSFLGGIVATASALVLGRRIESAEASSTGDNPVLDDPPVCGDLVGLPDGAIGVVESIEYKPGEGATARVRMSGLARVNYREPGEDDRGLPS